MTYALHPDAARDLEAACAFYGREGGAALANRFVDEFERIAGLLVTQPEVGVSVTGALRSFPLYGFPYSILYDVQGGVIRVLVVRHQYRDPDFGLARR